MLKHLYDVYRYLREYGVRCTIAHYLAILLPCKKKDDKLQWNILQFKHRTISRYLYKHYYIDSNNISHNDDKDAKTYSNCIWTAWLQGEDEAPEVIKLTLASIQKNANGHNVIIITNKNIDEYIDIPEDIKKKHETGIICHANYIDIVRLMLLSKYGGLWVDATIFMFEFVKEEAFSTPFFSIGRKACDSLYVSNNRWVAGVTGCCAHSVFLECMSSMIVKYWHEHSIPIDYFAIDYFTDLLYQNNNSFKEVVDQLPKMILRTGDLAKLMNEPYNRAKMNSMFIDNQIYSLTYRKQYIQTTEDGNITFYGHLINECLLRKS